MLTNCQPSHEPGGVNEPDPSLGDVETLVVVFRETSRAMGPRVYEAAPVWNPQQSRATA